MKYEKAKYEIWEQEPGIEGVYKQIERAGRVCYKSNDKMTNNSSRDFVQKMIDSKHYAMLEHGTVYLYIKYDYHDGVDMGDLYHMSSILNLNPHTLHNHNYETNESFFTTNLRVLVELYKDDWEDILKKYYVDYDARFNKRVTVFFTCDRFTGESFLRHRVFSFARESTRYCNYTKDKFNNEITFIEPCFSKTNKLAHEQMTSALKYAETYYKYLIQSGWKPEEARVVLPCAIKSPLVMTGFTKDWEHFFDLRAKGTTGKPHPQAKELAEPLMNEFKENGWIENEQKGA